MNLWKAICISIVTFIYGTICFAQSPVEVVAQSSANHQVQIPETVSIQPNYKIFLLGNTILRVHSVYEKTSLTQMVIERLSEDLSTVDSVVLIKEKPGSFEIFEHDGKLQLFQTFALNEKTVFKRILVDPKDLSLQEFTVSLNYSSKEEIDGVLNVLNGPMIHQDVVLMYEMKNVNSALNNTNRIQFFLVDFKNETIVQFDEKQKSIGGINFVHDALFDHYNNEFVLLTGSTNSFRESNDRYNKINISIDGKARLDFSILTTGEEEFNFASITQNNANDFLVMGSCSKYEGIVPMMGSSMFISRIIDGHQEFFRIFEHDELDHFYPITLDEDSWYKRVEKVTGKGKNFSQNTYERITCKVINSLSNGNLLILGKASTGSGMWAPIGSSELGSGGSGSFSWESIGMFAFTLEVDSEGNIVENTSFRTDKYLDHNYEDFLIEQNQMRSLRYDWNSANLEIRSSSSPNLWSIQNYSCDGLIPPVKMDVISLGLDEYLVYGNVAIDNKFKMLKNPSFDLYRIKLVK